MLADDIKKALHTAARATSWAEHAPQRWQDFPLETPKKTEHGHYATNMAMRLAKPLKRAPLQIAEELAAHVDTSGTIGSVQVVKPGFINIRASRAALAQVVRTVREQGPDYGKSEIGAGEKVQAEFVSANPTGPLSVGHGRLAAYGDSTARHLAAAGVSVDREFYVTDVGNQIAKLKGTIVKIIQRETGIDIELDENDYQGDYLIEPAKIVVEHIKADGNIIDNAFLKMKSNLEQLVKWVDGKESLIIKTFMTSQAAVLEKFNVTIDRWFRESELYVKEDDGLDQVQRTLDKLRESGDMYEKDGAVWFASSRYLDEKDRVVQKSDGNKTYLMSDIAYIYNKLGVRKFDTAIYVWGADHHGYIDRIKSAGQALGFSPERLEVIIVQLVSIKGERMSKRRGNIIYLDELIDEVGADATRFFFLARPPGTHCDFDMDLARDKSENNPRYYLQYVHARICTMIGKAEVHGLAPDHADLDRLGEPAELDLLKLLADFPWELQSAALAREPHRVINYLTAVAGKFHSFYHDHKVIQPDDQALSRARLALCDAVRTTFANGLRVLGISAPEQM